MASGEAVLKYCRAHEPLGSVVNKTDGESAVTDTYLEDEERLVLLWSGFCDASRDHKYETSVP